MLMSLKNEQIIFFYSYSSAKISGREFASPGLKGLIPQLNYNRKKVESRSKSSGNKYQYQLRKSVFEVVNDAQVVADYDVLLHFHHHHRHPHDVSMVFFYLELDYFRREHNYW